MAEKSKNIHRTPSAGKYTGLANSTLEKMRLTGEGPTFIRLTKRAVGYRQSDLDDWLESRSRKSTSQI